MKKFFSIFICFILLFTLCGCTDNTNNAKPNSTQTAEKNNSAITSVASSIKAQPKEESTNIKDNSSSAQSKIESSSKDNIKPESTDNSTSSKKSATSSQAQSTVESTTSIAASSTSIAASSTPIVSSSTSIAASSATPPPATCSHKNQICKNQRDSTCAVIGYTGDTYCKDCNAKIGTGLPIPLKGHNTVVENKKSPTSTSEGYTGDIYCKNCNTKISAGATIPKLQNSLKGKVTYNTNNGFSYTVPENTNITEHTMSLKTEKVNSPYRQIELEILRLCNEERAKANLKPLTWYEEAYCFATTRAKEACTHWGHIRPDGSGWHTVYTNKGVILNCSYGENLAQFEIHSPETVAQKTVSAWMDSAAHKKNILNPDFSKMTLAMVCGNDGVTFSAAQHFFGKYNNGL